MPKKGLGPLAWVGIGCGGLIVLVVIGIAAVTMMYGGKFKEFAEQAQKNPTRAAASTAVTFGAGQIEMVAEDDVNKRYTVREKKTGKLTTIYWNEKKQSPETIEGDFSAIPADPVPGSTEAKSEPEAPPAPAPAPAS